ncbi:MAG: NUDIX hydrolase [bacterium]|jgi:8-oxo-dGTP diphosphatase
MQRRYPTQPLVGVGAVIVRGNSILLIQRGKPPAQGLWSLPGGKVELGETLEAALRREIKEECNLDIEVGPPIAVLDSIFRDEKGQVLYHYTLVDFWVNKMEGKLVCSSDAQQARFVPRAELISLELTGGLLPLLDRLGILTEAQPTQPPAGVFYFTQQN